MASSSALSTLSKILIGKAEKDKTERIFNSTFRTVSMTIFGILFYMIVAYFVFSVGSFYVLMKRKNRNADLIVQSVSQGRIDWVNVTDHYIIPSVTIFLFYQSYI